MARLERAETNTTVRARRLRLLATNSLQAAVVELVVAARHLELRTKFHRLVAGTACNFAAQLGHNLRKSVHLQPGEGVMDRAQKLMLLAMKFVECCPRSLFAFLQLGDALRVLDEH